MTHRFWHKIDSDPDIVPEFNTLEEAYAWANSLEGAQILQDLFFNEFLTNGTTTFEDPFI